MPNQTKHTYETKPTKPSLSNQTNQNAFVTIGFSMLGVIAWCGRGKVAWREFGWFCWFFGLSSQRLWQCFGLYCSRSVYFENPSPLVRLWLKNNGVCNQRRISDAFNIHDAHMQGCTHTCITAFETISGHPQNFLIFAFQDFGELENFWERVG